MKLVQAEHPSQVIDWTHRIPQSRRLGWSTFLVARQSLGMEQQEEE